MHGDPQNLAVMEQMVAYIVMKPAKGDTKQKKKQKKLIIFGNLGKKYEKSCALIELIMCVQLAVCFHESHIFCSL